MGAMTRPAGLKEGNWCEECIGMVAAVEGTFMADMQDPLLLMEERLGELMAMGGFWSSMDMEESGMLWRMGSAETP